MPYGKKLSLYRQDARPESLADFPVHHVAGMALGPTTPIFKTASPLTMNTSHYMTLEGVSTSPKHTLGLKLLDFNLTFGKGDVLCVTGPSGSGKTGFLMMLAGLVRPDQGVIICQGQEVTGPSAQRALIPQWPALLPWLTCYQNVFLAVQRAHGRKISRSELHIQTATALQQMRLTDVQHQRPGKLDRDHQQRVSIARALAVRPQVLLLDEPFEPLDSQTMRWLPEALIAQISQRRITTVISSLSPPAFETPFSSMGQARQLRLRLPLTAGPNEPQ